jgi:hypothetical protein
MPCSGSGSASARARAVSSRVGARAGGGGGRRRFPASELPYPGSQIPIRRSDFPDWAPGSSIRRSDSPIGCPDRLSGARFPRSGVRIAYPALGFPDRAPGLPIRRSVSPIGCPDRRSGARIPPIGRPDRLSGARILRSGIRIAYPALGSTIWLQNTSILAPSSQFLAASSLLRACAVVRVKPDGSGHLIARGFIPGRGSHPPASTSLTAARRSSILMLPRCQSAVLASITSVSPSKRTRMFALRSMPHRAMAGRSFTKVSGRRAESERSLHIFGIRTGMP